MSFDSFHEFLAMGGHGLYVWLSYGAAVIIIGYNVVSVRLAQRRFLQEARDRQRRHAGTGDLPIANAHSSSSATRSHSTGPGESTRS